MASHLSTEISDNQKTENLLTVGAKQSNETPIEPILSEAARKHMRLIGTFLSEIIREWNERQQSTRTSTDDAMNV